MAQGILYVDSPDDISVIPDRSIRIAKEFEQIINDSGIEPYDRVVNTGFWRILLYRESKKTKQCMISIIVSEKESCPIEEEQITKIKSVINAKYRAG